jgi:hypothetical protein
MPSWLALTRRAPIVRFICLEIFGTGVRCFEWTLSALRSAAVHSRRVRFLFLVTFFNS